VKLPIDPNTPVLSVPLASGATQQSRGSDYRSEVPVERSFVNGEVGLRVIGRLTVVVPKVAERQ
jgi:hypothetical protein